jgi:6-phosphogluconolactonase
MTGTSGTNIRVLPDGPAVARAAADLFVELAAQAGQAGQPFRVALSGGSTPKMLYQLLSSDEYKGRVQWDAISFFFGDERWVPHDHPDSNYGLARDELFTKVPVDPAKIFPMPTEGLSPEEAAEQYEKTLAEQFGVPLGQIPEFELIFLGMGDDGHTASCFPGTQALNVNDRCVTANFVMKFNTYRLTLTPPVLQAGKEVVFMVAGQSKAPALHEVLEGEYNPDEYPSQLLRQAKGNVTWLVDEPAASQLEKRPSGSTT